MSQDPKTADVLAYVADLQKKQDDVILAGGFTRIEEYRAACTVRRQLARIGRRCKEIMDGQAKAEDSEDDVLQPMPEDRDHVG